MAYDEDEVDTAWDALEEALEQCAAKVASDNQVDNGYFVSPNPRCFKVLMAAGLRHVPLEYLTVLLKEYLRSRVAPQFCATVAAGGKQVKTSGSSLPRDENDEEASRGSWGASSEVNQLQQEAIARAVATAECCLSRALIAVAELLAAINEISSDEERQTHLVKSSELRTLKQELRQERDRLKTDIEALGMHLPPAENLLLSQPFIDGFRNISISPMHVLKTAYKDVLQLVVRQLWKACGTNSEWFGPHFVV